MTPEQIALVQESFKKVPAEAAAEIFYARLFELAPHLRGLFRGDMKAQGRKLMSMIAVAVNGLTEIERILPALRSLGARHAGYGVRPEHYDIVGSALIWTLEQGLGDDFTLEVKQAWVDAYGLVSTTMIHAADRAVVRPSLFARELPGEEPSAA